MKKKHALPPFLKLPYKFDQQRILADFKSFGFHNYDLYTDLLPGGNMYTFGCKYRPKFLENFLSDEEIAEQQSSLMGPCLHGGKSYAQLALTEFTHHDNNELRDEELLRQQTISAKERARRVDKGSDGYLEQADERNFSNRNDNVKGVFSDILDKFKAPLGRCRFAILNPGAKVRQHIDFNTDYAIRVHIPIITNEKAILGVVYKGEKIVKHLPADGSAWFINAAYPHFASNDGLTERVHLILTLVGQDDLAVTMS